MKKFITVIIIILSISVFAADWYSSKEKVTDLKMKQTESKDTLWCGYASDLAYVWNLPFERATFYNLDDFTAGYPVNLVGFSSYLYDAGIRQSYKLYDADGVTLLYQSPYFTSIKGYNDYMLDTPIVLENEFWISVTPDSAGSGLARHVSSSEQTSTHSYIGTGDGTWDPLADGTDYFEFETYAALATWEGPDTFAPIVNNLSGLEVFENVVADLFLTVKDQNPVVSPMASQYSVDGGTTWVDFDMTMATKSYQNFIGSIPGQVDGTTAVVKFFMADTLGNSTWSNEYQVQWSKDNPLLDESFEDDFPPPGWEQITVGSGFVKGSVTAEGAMAHTGDAALTHWDTEFDNDDWMITPTISIPATNSSTFSFWQNGYWMSYYEFHEVAITTDNGATWTQIYTGAPPVAPGDLSGDVGFWEQPFFTLVDYAGQDIQIGFHYMGNYTDQWFIDDVKVFYDPTPPVPVSLIGNPALLPVIGAYVNNPMDLVLTLDDVSEVASVTGHYDIGGNTGDVIFSKAKFEETWTGTVPALNYAVTGTINFTSVDIGGLTDTSSDYAIEFVADAAAPVVKNVSGTLAFINNPMTIELQFEDESDIATCKGHYSKDNWATQYDFDLAPTKVHEYSYSGIIPAETEEVLVSGFVYFEVTDEPGNILTTGQYQVQWLDGSVVFSENFESGTGNWVLTGNWGLEESTWISATHSLTESPDSVYTADNSSSATWASYLDLSTGYGGVNINFWCRYDLEPTFDYMHFEVSGDNGMTWGRLRTWTDEGVDWHEENIDLSDYLGESHVKFRWVFQSDGGYEANGMNIDDIVVSVNNTPNSPPVIIHEGPEFYGGVVSDYQSYAKVYDLDGVDSVWVEYSVDYSDTIITVNAEYSGLNIWEFMIPDYGIGSIIGYSIWASDASEDHLESHTWVYSYVTGEHIIYDGYIMSYIYELKDNAAWAEKITIDTDLTQWADLMCFLFRNYYDPSHISANMQAHVWKDNGGVPGVELIPAFDVTPVAGVGNQYGAAIIDLRSYGIRTNGDIWVGCSAPYGSVYAIYEVAAEEGTTDYQRSYSGTWTGSDWTWAISSGNNYHIRAVIGEKTGIEDNTLPVVTALYQNYPNPFNPSTEISYSLNSEGMVKLSVFNTKGELVSTLVNEKKTVGNHLVKFNGDGLNSGIYFYRLSVDGKTVQSRKMMMLK